LGSALVLLLAAGLTGTARAAQADDGTPVAAEAAARLLVADFEEPTVHLIDVGSGETVGSFGTLVPARLYASESGRFGFAVQPDADVVTVVDGGRRWGGAGGEERLVEGEPVVLETSLSGDKPIHFVAHGEQIAVFYDDDGEAKLIDEAGLAAAATLGGDEVDRPEVKPTTLGATRAHHGVAVPLGDLVLMSRPAPDPEESLPIGVDLMTMEGDVLDSFTDCPGLHGEAAAGEAAFAFACEDGIMLVERDGDEFTSRKIAYPEGEVEDTRAGYLAAAPDAGYLFGNFGDNGIVRIDPEAGTAEAITLPAPLGHFAVEPGEAGHLLVLTTDGVLHLFDPAADEPLVSGQVVDPAGFDEERNLEPGLVAAAGVAYLTDPAASEVVEVPLTGTGDDLAADRRFEVGDTPARLALLQPDASISEGA